jgi:hypothetical protein
MAFAPCSHAALSNYSQDFEAMFRADPAALANDGWLVFANVFDTDQSTFLYSYGVNPAPNGGAGFASVTGGQGDVNQGRHHLTVFNDYNNLDHATGKWIETLLFQEQTIGVADGGTTLSFVFDAKQGYISGSSTAQAFIKTLDPAAGFATTNTVLFDTTTLGSAWDTYTLSLMIPGDNSLNGQLLQFGFSTFATSYQSSDNYYDNINASVSAVPVPAAVWMFMSGFAAFALVARRSRSSTTVPVD